MQQDRNAHVHVSQLAVVDSMVGWLRCQLGARNFNNGVAYLGEEVQLQKKKNAVQVIGVGSCRRVSDALRRMSCEEARPPRRLPRMCNGSWNLEDSGEELFWEIVAAIDAQLYGQELLHAEFSTDKARAAWEKDVCFELDISMSRAHLQSKSDVILKVIHALTSPPRVASQPTVGAAWATMVIDELVRCGVDRFVVCPGSRSTPLALAITRHPMAPLSVIHDERAAAYYALGHGRVGQLACVLTTSGSAALNLLPAAAEADEDGVPLLFLTADRPPELRGVGADQALSSQYSMLAGLGPAACTFCRDLPPADDRIPGLNELAQISRGVHFALQKKAPVQLNLAFRENLAPRAGAVRGADAGPRAAKWANPSGRTAEWDRTCLSGPRFKFWEEKSARPMTSEALNINDDRYDDPILLRALVKAHRGILVLGRVAEKDAPILDWIVRKRLAHWPVIHCDPQSNLLNRTRRMPRQLLHLIRPERIDLVLQIGASCILSAPVRSLLNRIFDQNPSVQKVVAATALDAHSTRIDDDGATTLHWRGSLVGLTKLLVRASPKPDPKKYNHHHTIAEYAVEETLGYAFLHDDKSLCEPAIARLVTAHTSALGGRIFAANSMAVRDIDLFGAAGVRVAANRGLAGIDGVLATACGVAAADPNTSTTLLIGDQSFLHDLSSVRIFADTMYTCPSLKVILINNAGGAIFSFLPIAQAHTLPDEKVNFQTEFEPLFGAPHAIDFSSIAKAFGLRFARCSTVSALRRALWSPEINFIEAVPTTSRSDNVALHSDLTEKTTSAAVAALLGSKNCVGLVDLYFRRLVSSHKNFKKPVVALHGLFGTGRDLEPLFVNSSRDVLLFDLACHGRSGPQDFGISEDVLSFDAQIDSLLNTLDRAGVERFDVLGYSLGARLGMGLKKRAPSRVGKVIAISANLDGYDSLDAHTLAERRKADARLAATIRSLDTNHEAWLSFFDSIWYSASAKSGMWASLRHGDEKKYNQMLQRRIAAKPRAFALAATLEFAGLAVSPSLFEIAQSDDVTYVYGEEDSRCAASAARLQKNSGSIVVVPGAGHALPDEAPEILSNLINDVVKQDEESVIIVDSARVDRFDLPRKQPVASRWIHNRSVQDRLRGAVLVLKAGDLQAIGEASPCLGVHTESLEIVLEDLERFIAALNRSGGEIPSRLASFNGELGKWLDTILNKPLVPSARFAVETAIAQLFADNSLSNFYARVLHTYRVTSRVHIASLVADDDEPEIRHGSVVKIKVGQVTPQVDAQRVETFVASGRRVRVDANRQWSKIQFNEFVNALSHEALSGLEFIEEPCFETVSLLGDVQIEVPIALDETFAECNRTWNEQWNSAAAIVLKPAILGLENTIFLCRNAAQRKIPVVVSSCFESGIGLSHLVALAAALPDANIAHGLGTFDWLHTDLLTPFSFSDIVERSSPCAYKTYVDINMCEKALQSSSLVYLRR
eukprot:CAMPEP_0197310016 /NCGR_PEP_ID=MMETSP0891-20130614/8636_1 /TAXON_ID=44058 ORGANISM="Aureoumbra lagunensis, Strain CCMP1510" /NCGR_SAMPLE_ID=MMETSP0891 /ASSEMBLY_ACC=CAM_ASM_000534 /LENGTH=1457 /DNA_ID=CAMNT_0042795459 /DNA_START=233 /DNA_END=4606 /DNA_ORIENTATION=+